MVFDKSIDMSVMDDEKSISQPEDKRQNLKTIIEIEGEDDHTRIDKSNVLENSSGSQASATFPDIPLNLQMERSVSVEDIGNENTRRSTFRPPFDPSSNRYNPDRG